MLGFIKSAIVSAHNRRITAQEAAAREWVRGELLSGRETPLSIAHKYGIGDEVISGCGGINPTEFDDAAYQAMREMIDDGLVIDNRT